MSTVQRSPGGLLELLSAKTSGYTLRDLAPNLQPTIDLTAMLGLTTLEHVTANNAVAAENDSAVLIVPATEWWLLYAADLQYLKTATLSWFAGSIRINPPGSPNWCTVSSGPVVPQAFGSTPADQVAVCQFVPASPWLLQPGTQIYGRCDILGTDPTVDIGINARVTRLS